MMDDEIFREIEAAVRTLAENDKPIDGYHLYVSRCLWNELGCPEYFECAAGTVPIIVVDKTD